MGGDESCCQNVVGLPDNTSCSAGGIVHLDVAVHCKSMKLTAWVSVVGSEIVKVAGSHDDCAFQGDWGSMQSLFAIELVIYHGLC